MDLDKCSVCLSESTHLISANEEDANNVKLYEKIISIVPELVIKLDMLFV